MFLGLKKGLVVLFITLFTSTLLMAQEAETPPNPDPAEPVNRKLFALHKWVDDRFFRPLAVSYRAIVPTKVRKSVNNFFANVDELPITANHLMQGKPIHASKSMTRLAINTTFGVGGLFDVATDVGIPRVRADFGQTMYKWGWKNSTYIFVPLFGPTTLRDGTGVVADIYMMPWPYIEGDIDWYAAGLYAVNQRAKFIDTEGVLSVAALDEYSFIRDGYLQARKGFIQVAPLSDAEDQQEDWGDIL